VRQSAEPVTRRTPNGALPAAPWNSRGGGLFRGIFGGPTTTVRVFPPFAPRYSFAPQPNAPAAYASVNQGNAADYPIDPKYLRQVVPYPGVEKPGTIIIDMPNKFLYLIEDGCRALRYGIGVGRPGFLWAGVKTVTAKREWPDWRPPVEMIARQPDLPRFMPGGVDNPLGARALLSRLEPLSHPRLERAVDHRHQCILGLHPYAQRGRHRSLPAGEGRHQGSRDLNNPTSIRRGPPSLRTGERYAVRGEKLREAFVEKE
jgi:hypothetical protein